MTTVTDLPDGYYTVPAGKLANAVVWLEMRARPRASLAHPLTLEAATDRAVTQALFAEIGTPWLWSSAYKSTDASHGDRFYALDDGGERVGIIELDRRARGVEIAYFGLRPSAIGQGLGTRMMAAALAYAWRNADRVWLHTCNFDHPAALRFYESCGFRPYANGFEIMSDPRLDGKLPREAAPHVPLLAHATG